MDAELRDELDTRFAEMAEILSRAFAKLEARLDARFEAIDRRFEAIDRRFEAIDRRFDTMHKEMVERFMAVDERFATMNLGIDHLCSRIEGMETAVTALIDRMDRVEAHQIALRGRLDGISEDIRQRFRVVNDRLAELALRA